MTDRRQFLAGLAAAGTLPLTAAPSAGNLVIHFIHTGAGESVFFVFPDGTSLLLDCGGDAAINRGKYAVPVLPDGTRHNGEWIARYVRRANPRGADVDYLCLSHFHSDHAGTPKWCAGRASAADGGYALSGFAQAAQQLRFKTAIDRGWPDYREPALPFGQPEVLENMKRLYAHLARRDGLTVEKIRLGASDQIVPRQGPATCPDFSVRTVCANGKIALPDGTVRDVFGPHCRRCDVAPENAMSIGFIVTYGAFRLFTGGDFCDIFREKGAYVCFDDDLADAVCRVDVAKVNHHGCDSMSRKLVAALAPRVWTAGVWDQYHMSDSTMALLSDRTIYPGTRLIAPGVYTAEHRLAAAGKPWLADLAPETFGGAHVVITVPPGGKTYTVEFFDAACEEPRKLGERRFDSRS